MEHILEKFNLVLMVNGAESCRKSVISLRILTNDIIALNYYDVNISKYGVIYGTTLGF